MFGSIFLAILGISLLIFVHEAGHFLFARLAGVRVEVFSLGFGSRLCGFYWRGTDFRLSLVPFAGYVMVAGQDPSDRRYPARESLYGKSIGQRTLFWSGGVMMNALFALIVFPLVFHAGVPFLAPVLGTVERGGAAWEAGLEPGDRILAIGGREVYSFENLRGEFALNGQRPVQLLVRRPDHSERTVTVTPHWDRENAIYSLGVGFAWRPEPPRLTVADDGPARRVGLENGDRLLAVDGISTVGASLPDAMRRLGEHDHGPLPLTIRRGEREFTLSVEPAPAKEPAAPMIGVEILPRVVFGLRSNLPWIERLGLRRGDVILAIDDRPFVAGVLDEFRTGPEELSCTVARSGAVVSLAARVTAAERASLPEVIELRADDSLVLSPKADGAAMAAGLRAGDRVVAIDGVPMTDFAGMRDIVRAAQDRPLRFQVERVRAAGRDAIDGERAELRFDDPVALTITPRRAPVYDLGFKPEAEELSEIVRADSIGDAIRLGIVCSIDLVKQLYVTLKRLATGEVGAKNLGGIIRIGTVSYHAAQRGTSWFWYFLALLSVNLAFVNLLPIPVLDGGHLLFLLIEKVKGSPVSSRVLGYSQVVGLVFVLMLVLFVTYNDILWLL